MINLGEKIKSWIKDLILLLKSFFVQEFFQNPIVDWLLILNLLINFVNWLVLIFFLQPVDFPLILHYNVYFGVDLKGNYTKAFLIPLAGFLLTLINFWLSFYLYREKERIASYLLLLAALMVQTSLLIYSLSLIIINY